MARVAARQDAKGVTGDCEASAGHRISFIIQEVLFLAAEEMARVFARQDAAGATGDRKTPAEHRTCRPT